MSKRAYLFEEPGSFMRAVGAAIDGDSCHTCQCSIPKGRLSLHPMREEPVLRMMESRHAGPVAVTETALYAAEVVVDNGKPWDDRRRDLVLAFSKEQLVAWLSQHHGVDLKPLLLDA